MPDPLRPLRLSRRRLLVSAAALAAPWRAALAEGAPALRLLVIEQPGCPGCARFEAESAPALAALPPGRALPLTRIDLRRGPWPGGVVIGARPPSTPAFLLLADGVERARLLGYPGPAGFSDWLARQRARLG